MKDILTTLLIIFITLKLIDFHNLGILDVIIMILVIILLCLTAIQHIKKGRNRT